MSCKKEFVISKKFEFEKGLRSATRDCKFYIAFEVITQYRKCKNKTGNLPKNPNLHKKAHYKLPSAQRKCNLLQTT